MADTTTTRRAMLGAISTAPVALLITPAVAAAADRGTFDAALADYHRCYAEQEAYYVANNRPANDENDRWEKDTPEWRASYARVREHEEVFGDYVSRTGDAMDRLLLMPAPDHDALATKLELMLFDERFDCGCAQTDIAKALLADVRRLGMGMA